MDTRRIGLKSLSKAGCYYILFGAVLGACVALLSLFVEFDVKNQNEVTILFSIVSLVLFASFYVAIRQFEDPSKMILEFHPPKAQHRAEIQSICENIYKVYNKKYKPVYVFLMPVLIGFFCFTICYSSVPLTYFLSNATALLTSFFLLPTLFTGLFSFFIWGIIYRNRIEEIQNGAYAVAEVSFVEKYYCIHSSAKTSVSTRTVYFVILADSHGNKGRFQVSESDYYRFHADDTILLVKRSKGKLFYNAMEPISILEYHYEYH